MALIYTPVLKLIAILFILFQKFFFFIKKNVFPLEGPQFYKISTMPVIDQNLQFCVDTEKIHFYNFITLTK